MANKNSEELLGKYSGMPTGVGAARALKVASLEQAKAAANLAKVQKQAIAYAKKSVAGGKNK